MARLRQRALSVTFGCVVVSACSLASVSARAQAAQVEYAASDARAADLEQTLANASALPGASATITRVSSIDPNAPLTPLPDAANARPVARIFVDVTEAARVHLYIVDREGTRIYVRSLPHIVDNFALEDAQIGEIVRSAVQALSQGAVIGIALPAPALPLPAAALPPTAAPQREREPEREITTPMPPARSPAFLLGAFYGLGLRADGGTLAQGPGLYAGVLNAREGFAWGVLGSAQYQPHHLDAASVSAQLSTFALRIGPVIDLTLSSRLGLRVALRAGADLVAVSTHTQTGKLVASDSQLLSFAMLQPMLALRYRASPHLEASVALAVDIDLVDTRFLLRTRSDTTTLEDPWALRPALVLGLGFY